MDFYVDDGTSWIEAFFASKRLLVDSVDRTLDGWNSVCEGTSWSVLMGSGNVLLARVEAVGAFVICSMAGTLHIAGSLIGGTVFVIGAGILNLAARPLSGFECVNHFVESSSDAIFRTVRVNAVAIPAIGLFLAASAISTFIPGLLKADNIFFKAIHFFVSFFGEEMLLHRLDLEDKWGKREHSATDHTLSVLEVWEDSMRALSHKILRSELKASGSVTLHTTTTYYYSY